MKVSGVIISLLILAVLGHPASSVETVLLDTITPAIAADNYGIYGVWHTQ